MKVDFHELFNYGSVPALSKLELSLPYSLQHSLLHVHGAEIFLLPLQGAKLNLGEYTLSGSALHRSEKAISKNKIRLHRDSTNDPTKLVSKYMAQVASNPDNPVSGN